MPDLAPHSRRGRLTAAAAGVLVLAGVLLLVVGLRAQRQPPQPPAAAAATSTAPSTSAQAIPAPPGTTGSSRPAPAASGKPALARSVPVSLDIPAIKVRSQLLQLGLNADNTVQVPPLARDSQAGWYKYSPTPGQLGPSVILGHVDSAEYGPGIFFRLGALRPGDTATVTLADRSTAVFRVDRVVAYPKDSFPTLAVYGNTDDAQLRLITCGGSFDRSAHSYRDNIVAFATLVSSRRG
ncbi:MAG: class F sortase [Actinobacteria bacterium]|nr:class F sortase [Actinomycetota bacterium]